jgi:antirestriction protein ArdC
MPGPDRVEMPAYGSFATDDDFASTLGHELSHATGHPSRLNRRMNAKVFKEAYAAEECVAELASAFLCAHLGFSYIEAQSPAYIESWLKVLKQDTRAIFSLASYASQAADWLRQREHVVTGPNDPDELARIESAVAQAKELVDDEIPF